LIDPIDPAREALHQAREALLTWFSHNQRTLPWRTGGATRDPYGTWISEVMLQQTQVATVIDRHRAWMRQFPTLEALATAPQEQVLEAWRGLGYYARARNLHRGAQLLVEEFGGTFPTDRRQLESIPGIGPYTAGAILSLACGLREPLLDGNVFRVFSRRATTPDPAR